MLRITLYKECILSHEYSEVFHHTVFEQYLQDLVKRQLPDLDLVYYEKEGTLVFDYALEEDNIYEYNYMKIEVYNDDVNENSTPTLLFTRYCFISSIIVQNGYCYVDYEEDRWQSYSKDLKIRDSYLSRSRHLNYHNSNYVYLRNLPVEYNGNNPFYYERIHSYSDEYIIFLQVQKYNASTYGSSTKRRAYTTTLYKEITKPNNKFDLKNIFNLNDALEMILVAYKMAQGEHEVREYNPDTQQWETETFYYQIGNVTLIPAKLLQYNSFNFLYTYFPQFELSTIDNMHLQFKKIEPILYDGSGLYIAFPELTNARQDDLNKGKKIVFEYTLNNDFKNYSIGTMTNQFELVNNGLSHNLRLTIEMNTYNFDLYLEIDKKEIAITNDFVLNIPFSYLNGEELSQQKMSRVMNNIKAVGNIVEGAVDVGLTIGTAGANKAIVMATKVPKTVLKGMGKRYKDAKNKLNDINEGSGLLGGANDIISGISGLVQANAPVYSSSKGTFTYDDGILNSYSGIVVKKIISQNDDYVQNFIDETGYITYQIGGNEFLENYYVPNASNPVTYNILKFDFVKAYGKFPQDICDDLKSILLNGFKIRYTNNV